MKEEKNVVVETEEGTTIVNDDSDVMEAPDKKGILTRTGEGFKKHWKKILVGGLIAGGLFLLGKGKNSKSDVSDSEFDYNDSDDANYNYETDSSEDAE